tara:strand:+ start:693 stop:1247 length:555 start_codon:yes stop_codon:yes gene_type:complete
MNKEKQRKNFRMVKLPVTGDWVSEKLAMQFKSLDIMDKRMYKNETKVYKCVLDGKTVTTDKRYTKAVYVLSKNGKPIYPGSTKNQSGNIMSRPLQHRKPGRYQKDFDGFDVIALPDDACHLMAEMFLIERLRRKYNLRNDGHHPPMKYSEWNGLLKLWQSYCKRRNTHTEPFGLNKEIINFKGI